METYYRANQKLLIPNGPGSVPSSIRAEKGDIFSLDGTEPIDVALLLRHGAISPAEKPRTEALARVVAPSKRKPAIRRK